MGAGDIDAVGVNINNMGSFETVFDVIGEGSTAMVEDLIISDIDFTASDPPLLWTAVTIRENGMASFVDTTVSNSTNIRHVFSAAVSSTLDILRAQISGLTGGRAVVSTIHGALSAQYSPHCQLHPTKRAIPLCRTPWLQVPLSLVLSDPPSLSIDLWSMTQSCLLAFSLEMQEVSSTFPTRVS